MVAFLRDCVQEPAVLLGWSLGSMVAMFVAAAAPELVRAVVMDDPMPTLIDGLRTEVIIAAARQSAMEERWVAIAESIYGLVSSLVNELQ